MQGFRIVKTGINLYRLRLKEQQKDRKCYGCHTFFHIRTKVFSKVTAAKSLHRAREVKGMDLCCRFTWSVQNCTNADDYYVLNEIPKAGYYRMLPQEMSTWWTLNHMWCHFFEALPNQPDILIISTIERGVTFRGSQVYE